MTIGQAREAAASRASPEPGDDGWGLPDALGFALSAGRAIFLDLRSDRYFSINIDPGPEGLRDIAAVLRDEGLLVPGGRPVEPTRRPIAARQLDLGAIPALGPGSLFDQARAAAALVRARRQLKRGRLQSLVRPPAAHARRADRAGDAGLLAARFHGCRRLIPVRLNCLQDSLALLDFLAGSGVTATLVFGVKADPFSAHCWVERDVDAQRPLLSCGLAAPRPA